MRSWAPKVTNNIQTRSKVSLQRSGDTERCLLLSQLANLGSLAKNAFDITLILTINSGRFMQIQCAHSQESRELHMYRHCSPSTIMAHGRNNAFKLSGSSDRPAYPGFMVMFTAQVGTSQCKGSCGLCCFWYFEYLSKSEYIRILC